MSTFVLVHGAWHGSWCWTKVVPLLEGQGHRVEAIDLPGHGRSDSIPPSEITMQTYVDHVIRVIDRQTEPVILVGHSMGGSVISQTAEYRPDKIKVLVYLTAFLLPSGKSIFDADQGGNVLEPYVEVSEDGYGLTLSGEGLKPIFYNQCADEDIEFAKTRMVVQSTIPPGTPLATTEHNFGRVPRIYIECLNDQAITPAFQKSMYSDIPCAQVLSIEADHAVFFSAPNKLASLLTVL